MNEFCVIENGIIVNIIVCDNADIFPDLDLRPSYDAAEIGREYNLPEIVGVDIRDARMDAISSRQDFLEECIAELATAAFS